MTHDLALCAVIAVLYLGVGYLYTETLAMSDGAAGRKPLKWLTALRLFGWPAYPLLLLLMLAAALWVLVIGTFVPGRKQS